ncbi:MULTISPECIES: DUF4097 family beta strand repeat-containing protein [unclassified Paenibacillus]|uniref:DUF4097 family beta strand repeat-containing protein n=1 Tax=unclassified Paenibacillus TaxID=185978 RepID=UPI001C116A6D|nr:MULTISPECIES: DUF4097 family beta strand repeat-containing protein [unclassified Paenibacillus]MBU5443112.1 DUF4097 domain-containing protein [Paenibacillus sp. MSJ-34]CAH0122284.1 hypothetical protein PAE9249_04832 [Paenibacillus sp. CECT 9249]
MRKIWVALALICIVVGLGGLIFTGFDFIYNTGETEYSKKWTFEPGQLNALDIKSDYRVRVEFVQSPDHTNFIEVRGKASEEVAGKVEKAAIAGTELRLDLKNEWKLELRFLNFSGIGEQVVTVSLADGAILDTLRADTGSNRLTIDRARVKNASLVTSSGGLRIDGLTADDIQLASSSGSIRGEKIAGNITVKGSSGKIWIEQSEGAARIHSTSGNVTLTQERVSETDVRANSGSVRITVPRDFAGVYDVQTGSGSKNVPESKGQTDEVVKVRTSSGSVRIVPS